MSSVIYPVGAAKQLDRQAEPDEQVTPDQLDDKPRMVRLLMRVLKDIAALKRRWSPEYTDFRDQVVLGDYLTPVTVRLHHNFGGPVTWWVVRMRDPGLVQTTQVTETAESDSNTLVLGVYYAATIDIRVEKAS